VVVGVNDFTTEEPAPSNLFQVNPEVARLMVERLDRLRARRDPSAVERALASIDRAARGRDNLMPPILEAVKVSVTLGEVCDTLRGVFGVHQPSVVF
jgi:methylmalonyl-CoA mutase N-terminal domain/subunit